MLNWGYAWGRAQDDEDSQVKGMVGVAPLPVFGDNESATCIGGWQWVINNYSDSKDAAFELIDFLSSPESQRRFAVEASRIPARASLYQDATVLKPHRTSASSSTSSGTPARARSRRATTRFPNSSARP